MTETEKDIYAAGLFDGEGCVYIVLTKKNSHQMKCCVSMTDPEPIVFLKDTYGGNIRSRARTKKWKIIHEWILTGQKAEIFIRRVMPYSFVKRKQFEIVLEFRSRLKPQREKRTPLTEEEYAIRAILLRRLKEMKHEKTLIEELS